MSTMGLQEDFDQAAKDALTLSASTSNDDKLILYGLFKMATVGKPEVHRPGIFDPKGRAKWDAWKKGEGKAKDEAMQGYILRVTQGGVKSYVDRLILCADFAHGGTFVAINRRLFSNL